MLFIIIITLISSSLTNTVADDDIFDPESVFEPSPRNILDFEGLAAYDGYKVDTHFVVTRDGYILRLFRILSKCTEGNLEPLIFLHGLFLSADTGILNGKDSHCFVYSDNCYDVWVPNFRGNKYSRNHTTLDPDKDMEFWDYDFDEMALEDMPAILDYIILVTGKAQVIIVAHSQGVTVVLLLCAARKEYNLKIRILFGMSSAFWLDHARVFILDIEAALAPGIIIGSNLGFHGEIIKNGGILSKLAILLCGLTTLTYPVCSAFVFAFFGYNHYEITARALIDTVNHEPSGSSYDLFGRWGTVRSCGFRRGDYGILKNLEIYGSITPSEYSFENVTLECFFMSSDNDYVSHPLDLAKLLLKLINCRYKNCHLNDTGFGHLDYVLGRSAKLYCIDLILAYLKDGSLPCIGNLTEG